MSGNQCRTLRPRNTAACAALAGWRDAWAPLPFPTNKSCPAPSCRRRCPAAAPMHKTHRVQNMNACGRPPRAVCPQGGGRRAREATPGTQARPSPVSPSLSFPIATSRQVRRGLCTPETSTHSERCAKEGEGGHVVTSGFHNRFRGRGVDDRDTDDALIFPQPRKQATKGKQNAAVACPQARVHTGLVMVRVKAACMRLESERERDGREAGAKNS